MYTIYDIDSFSKDEYLDFFKKLLTAHYYQEIKNILAQPDQSVYYSVVVEFSMILEGDVNFGPLFLAEPRKLLPIFNEGLFYAQQAVLQYLLENNGAAQPLDRDMPASNQSIASYQGGAPRYTVKRNCRVRVCDLPICKEINNSSLPKSSDIGLFIEMRGTVIRTGQSKVLEKSKFFSCNKCSHSFEVFIDFEQYNQFAIPKKCPNPDARCTGTLFTPSKGIGAHCDFQEIKLQEQIHQMGAGSIPRSILILLQEDLVDACQAGDDITVSGVVIRRWRPLKPDERCDIEVVVLANHIRVMNEQRISTSMTDEIRSQFEEFWIANEQGPLAGRNTILSHICPGVYGLFVVRLALMLVLIGGVAISKKDRSPKVRGDCHLLLVGEPGTGKSQFLKYAAKLASRSVITTGIGTTSAGLTASAVREAGGEMVLEAGALVLADGGVCCIDEFSGIKEADRATIHEAMEQQTLSIAKAGVISKLHTRTSIIAATNAKGKYDSSEPITVNTSLPSTLLSRFDIILLLTDNQDTEWDTLVSGFILKQNLMGANTGANADNPVKSEPDFWNIDMLQSYIYYVKANFQPLLTSEAKKLIENYYGKQRSSGNLKNEGRTTARLLESLIRLSQAHARLMFRNTVEVQDAIVAIFMIESSVESSCILTNLNAQHSIFPDNPDQDYKSLEKKIKNSLGLSDLQHQPLPRKKTKPKQSNHKTNTNWVNDNYDEDEDDLNNNGDEYEPDEGEEVVEEEEEEKEEENQFKIVVSQAPGSFKSNPRFSNDVVPDTPQATPTNQKIKNQSSNNIQPPSSFDQIFDSPPKSTPITQQSNVNNRQSASSDTVIFDTPQQTPSLRSNHNNNNIVMPPPSSSSRFKSPYAKMNETPEPPKYQSQNDSIMSNGSNTQIRNTDYQQPEKNQLFNDNDLFEDLDWNEDTVDQKSTTTTLNNTSTKISSTPEPMNIINDDDDDFQPSYREVSKNNSNNSRNSSQMNDSIIYTQENENIEKIYNDMVDDTEMDWNIDDEISSFTASPKKSQKDSSNIMNTNTTSGFSVSSSILKPSKDKNNDDDDDDLELEFQ